MEELDLANTNPADEFLADINSEINNVSKSKVLTSKAKAIRELLEKASKATVGIDEIRNGMFVSYFPSQLQELAPIAEELFARIKAENNLSKVQDLVYLYYWVINFVKMRLLDNEFFDRINTNLEKGKPILREDLSPFLRLQDRLLTSLANVNSQYMRDLALTRDKRMTKEVRAINSQGQSFVMWLSNRATDTPQLPVAGKQLPVAEKQLIEKRKRILANNILDEDEEEEKILANNILDEEEEEEEYNKDKIKINDEDEEEW